LDCRRCDDAGGSRILRRFEFPVAAGRLTDFLWAHASVRARLWVRINPIQGPLGLADLAMIMPAAPAGIMLPKPRHRADAELLDHYLTAFEAAAGTVIGSTQVMLLVTEEPSSLLAIGDYAGVPRVAAMSWGAEDLATALGARDNRGADGRYEFTYELARSLCLIGAAAVDFINFCPIRQQLMSNFVCAVRFRPYSGHRSIVRGDIRTAIALDAAPTSVGLARRLKQTVLPVALAA
jgi:citrate lyase beta subunit